MLTQSFHSAVLYARANIKLLRCLLKAGVECNSFKSVDSRFHTRGAATEKCPVADLPSCSLDQAPLLDECKNECKGTSDAGVNEFVR